MNTLDNVLLGLSNRIERMPTAVRLLMFAAGYIFGLVVVLNANYFIEFVFAFGLMTLAVSGVLLTIEEIRRDNNE